MKGRIYSRGCVRDLSRTVAIGLSYLSNHSRSLTLQLAHHESVYMGDTLRVLRDRSEVIVYYPSQKSRPQPYLVLIRMSPKQASTEVGPVGTA